MTKYSEWKIGSREDAGAKYIYANVEIVEPNILWVQLDEKVFAYREVIEPKRETVRLWAERYSDGEIGCASHRKYQMCNLRITYDILDGVPDWSTARIEEVA